MVGRRIALVGALALLGIAGPAHAAFPGENGKIAFTRGFSVVTVMNPDGTGETDLNPENQNQKAPAWSPDGTKLAFARTVAGLGTPHAIYTMNPDGTDLRRVTSSDRDEARPAWSPDGRKLVFERVIDDSTCDNFVECGEELFTINVDGTGERRLTDNHTFDLFPAWSPDGSKIAFSRFELGSCVNQFSSCNWDIVTIDPDGAGEVNLLHNDEANLNPNWSPDGAQIAFSSTLDSCCVGEIFTMKADGTGLRQLTSFPHPGDWFTSLDPAWSPDGTEIVFSAGYAGSNHDEIQTVDVDHGDVTRLTDRLGVKDEPDWQPINRQPDCSGASASRPVLTTANRRLIPITLAVPDPDRDSVTVSIDGVTQDEPVTGRGDATAPDAVDEGDGELRVRAERNPQGDGRVYRIAFTATDGRGGSCSGTATVGVPRHRKKPAVDSAPPSYDSFGR
jgi:dipeptidyl aminopeptidase/acylaminoacyl peptidase